MKEIRAFIQPHKLGHVTMALLEIVMVWARKNATYSRLQAFLT